MTTHLNTCLTLLRWLSLSIRTGMYSYIWICFFLIITCISGNNDEFNIDGTTADGWEFVRDLFRENFVEERDLGASLAIYYQGNLVVDLQGGWFDKLKSKSYDNNSLQLVFSTTKGLVAIAVALCVQQGLLDYSKLVTNYWPEYGQNGKENTTVADILSHRAGLPFDFSPFDDYLNWTLMTNRLEQGQPVWKPGTTHGYHALTYGWLAGELVRRVDPKNRTLGEFIRDEIAKPLQIEFYVGLPSEQEYRVSPLDLQPYQSSLDDFNKNTTHRAEIPGGNGITNARSLARLYASLIGNVENNRYQQILTEDILKRAIKSNTPPHEIDFVLNITTTFAMGFSVMNDLFPSLGSEIFGHQGIGGSIGFAAPEKNLSFAYVVNRLETQVIDIDHRYKTMIKDIAQMIDRNHATNLINNFSFHLLTFFVFFHRLRQ
ncbi:unnamed protein product [Adineta ricciae]|uniref:Beta-lactamase-related domain-containing protein n=1 Tax=Adineta ricciae TaxID=249248 RepID=A0A815J586_ADIRI|nr:unnamed protein product [Adineta ricciae]CAF1374556.1 unnamed protein product [Adineta ricciae]